jgi:hypothetical protein
MSKHTKGPWRLLNKTNQLPSVIGPDNKSITSTGNARSRDGYECLANARLIAAAPELLIKVRQLATLIKLAGPALPGNDLGDLERETLALIEKAEGRE